MLQSQRNKLDADRLVDSLKRKGNSSRELQLKGYHIASLYHQSKEHSTALPYCQNYISAKPNDARAHKLLGQIHEALKNVPKAIEGYRKAVELNDMQKDVILKIAELYCQVRCEPERHRYWAERAEKYYPGHEAVHKIREHIFRASGKLSELEQYLRAKLRTYPNDANLHVQYLLVLVELGRINDAKQLCVRVENSHLFDNHQRWWEQAISVYLTMLRSWSREQSHHAQVACITTYCSLLYAINRLVKLSLANASMPAAQTAEILKRLDHDLVKASDCVASSQYSSEVAYAQATLDEMKAQMYYHVGSLLMKMAANGISWDFQTACPTLSEPDQKNQVRWHDVIGMATVAYLVSLQVEVKESYANSKMESLANLYKMGCSRLSEICHVLHGLVKQHGADWLEECVEKWCNEEGRQQFLYQVFGDDSGVTDLSSLHVDDSFLLTNTPELPDLVESVFHYDQVSVMYEPSDLHRLVWLGMQWDIRQDGILPDLGSLIDGVFERIVFSTNNLDNISVDNIRLLDIEAFLYASVHVAGVALSHLNEHNLINNDLPKQRPLVLHRGLCSEEQREWYNSLYQLYSGKAKSNDRAKLRLTSQKGLEVLRCRINHGMEITLLVQLGKTFHARMIEVQSQSDDPYDKREQWQAYQRMSVLYWQAALEQLKLLASGKAIPQQKKPFFPYQQEKLKPDQIQPYLDEGSVVVSEYKFQLGKHQEAVSFLDKAKTPNALYTKAMMFKTLAGMQTDGRTEDELNSSHVSQHGELLDKAKYALFATMDSIEDKPNHSLHAPVQDMLEEIESKQNNLANQLSSFDGPHDSSRLSDLGDISNRSRVFGAHDFEDDQQVKDPSPRRLAAELRAMNASHTRVLEENSTLRELQSSHSRILEQNQMLMERQNEVMESNNNLMRQIVEMNQRFQELSTKLSQPPPPAPPPQPVPDTSLAATITPNKPIIITAQNVRIETPNVSGVHPPVVASPVHHLHGMYHPGYAAPPNAPYYPAHHAYGYSYDSPTLPPGMMQTAQQGPHGHIPSTYQPYEDMTPPPVDSEIASSLSFTQNINQVVPPSSTLIQHPGYASPLAGLLASQANQRQGQQSPQTIPVKDPNRATAMPDVASRPVANGTFFGGETSITPSTPGSQVAADSPLLMSMLLREDSKPADPFSSSSGMGLDVSAQPGSIASGIPVPPQSALGKPAPAKSMVGAPAQQASTPTSSKSATMTQSPQAGLFGKSVAPDVSAQPATPTQQSFMFVKPSPKPAEPQASTAKSGPTTRFIFGQPRQLDQPMAAFSKPITTTPPAISTFSFRPSPQASSTPTTTAAPNPFAGFSLSVPSGNAATSTTSSVLKPAGSPVFGQAFKQPPKGDVVSSQADKPAVPLSTVSFTKATPTKPAQDEDVVFVHEKLPSAALQAKAKCLLLPITFYNYEDAPPCLGCIGCLGDDIDLDALIRDGFRKEEGVVDTTLTNVFAATSDGSGLFGGISSSGISFATLASATDNGFAKKDISGTFAFANAGAQLFGQGGGGGTDDQAGTQQEYDPHYEPIVALPEVVDLKTGHEDEESLYKQRCRLYRFDAEKNMWKERGVGDVKLMRHTATGRVRVVMRRDQVHKVCANHTITTAMQLKALETSDRAWIYSAIDFSGGDASPELLAIKFKNPDIAYEFKAKFEECQAEIAQLPDKQAIQAEENPEEASDDLMAKFAAKPGEWNCDACYARNPADTTVCLACSTPNPCATSAPAIAPAASVGFRTPQTNTSQKPDEDLFAKFKPKVEEWRCEACYVRNQADKTVCIACNTPKPGAAPATAPATASATSVGFTFGTSQTTITQKPDEDLLAKFNPEVGKWRCDACYVRNQADKTVCPACNTPKPGTAEPASSAPTTEVGKWRCDACYVRNQADKTVCPACNTPKPGTAEPASSAPTTAQPELSVSSSGFKIGPGGFPSFSYPTQSTPSEASTGGGFTFPQNIGFSFETDPAAQPEPTPVKQPPLTTEPVTTPGGTPTTRFSFDAGDSRRTGLPQFSFGRADKDPKPTSTGFVFGGITTPERDTEAVQQTPPSQYPFTQALQTLGSGGSPSQMSSSFAEMAQTQGSTFSFRMDIGSFSAKPSPPKPQKSPGLLRSIKSPGAGTNTDEYYTTEEGDDIHFEPIVQLPEKVELKTGEEDESVMFSHRCKLYRFDAETSQWKERGIGDIKLLHNPSSGRYRIVMRRDQVFRVCANHYLSEHMKLSPHSGSDKSLVWQAMDAADGEPELEQLAVRFKTPETTSNFKTIFEAAIEDLKKNGSESASSATPTESSKSGVTGGDDSTTPETSDVQSSEVSSSSGESKDTAAAKPVEDPKPVQRKVESAFSEIFKNSPVPSSIVTSNVATKEHNPEEERDIHFEPITQLPEKVDLHTGEENETQLFCSRAKLYRFDAEAKAWKDRGVGDAKILSNETTGRFRIIMRREQVLKVCANHYITPEMKLKPNAGSRTSWVWLAMDASEGEPQFEQLAIKFKFEETAQRYKLVFEECLKKLLEADREGVEEKKDESTSESQAATTTETTKSQTASNRPATPPQAAAPTTSQSEVVCTPAVNTSTVQGSPVVAPSDDTEEDVAASTLGASPDVIPKSTASPTSPPKSTESGLIALVQKEELPVEGLVDHQGNKTGELSSDTTTTSSSNSNSHNASDNEEDDVGVSDV